jgi:transposase-like protein
MEHKAKTRQQVADEYGVSVKTLYRWIICHKLSIEKGLLTPKEQQRIYKLFGKPHNINASSPV